MLAKLSVKKPYTVIVAIILVIALGVISFMNMTSDLLPSMDLPYMIVYTTYTGATPERVEADVTRPLEGAFSTLTDIKNVTSTSSENVSMVIMEFEAGADMDTALIEISSEVDQLSGGWDDAIGTPVIMKLNPDMLPVTMSTVSLDGADLLALSDYVSEELLSEFEAVDGVARVSASGILTQQVDITIEQSRIDVLNNAILEEVDKKLAKVERELRKAQGQISDGKSALARAKISTMSQIDGALAAIDQGETNLPTAIAGLEAQKLELTAQLEGAKAALAQLEGMVNMDDAQKEELKQLAGQLAALETQRDELQKQLDDLGEGESSDALSQHLAAAQQAREEQAALKAAQESYISDLQLLDKEALENTIKQLEKDISANNEEISGVRAQLETAIVERDAAQRAVTDLTARIEALGVTPEPTATPTPEPTPEPTPSPVPTEAPLEEVVEEPTEPALAATELVTGEPTSEPTEGEATSEPTEGENTAEPGEGEATSEPAEGDSTAEPTEGEATSEPAEGDSTAEPTEGETTAEPGEGETTAEPTEGETTSEPTEGETTAEPGEGEATSKPAADDTGAPAQDTADEPGKQDDSAVQPGNDPEPAAVSEDNSSEDKSEEPKAEEPKSEEPKSEEPKAEEPKPEEPRTEEVQTASLLDRIFGVAAAEGETLEELQQQLSEAQTRLATAQSNLDVLDARHESLRETLNSQDKALNEAKSALALLEEGEIAVQSRIDAANEQIAACDARIAELDKEIESITAAIQQGDIRQQLTAQISELDQQITALKESDAYKAYQLISDKNELNKQYVQAQEGVAQLEAGILSVEGMLTKLNEGILPGGMIEGIDEDTDLSEARQQLVSARAKAKEAFSDAYYQIKKAENKIASAWYEFTEERDKALEEAGIDGIITVETISGILGSQNLDLPAGYALNGEDRYLVSVGREFASLAELKQIKLFSLGLDSVDDVRLLDVARVEISDNSDDLFTFVNGERGIMLSFEKQSTASTAEVAKNITARSEELMAENSGLHIVEMMNQGDYIDLIVSSVLDNLVSGGALAILVLLLFLMDWRPTLIVAISIPVSVVVAFVCMYFSGITLNVMSLSGLALGVGMLVDNSIVTIENIYRLKDEEGLPLLTACIRGVNQVGGALVSSTLTTICVFLPVVFIEGMARDLFSDMGLTIAFSLIASLVVAMTVVPSFAAGLFKRSKPHKRRFFGAFQAGYIKLLRGALKVKLLVLLVAVALLGYCVWQIKDMPISFMPSVSSEQMSASLSFEDTEIPDSRREAVALSIMEGIMEVEGVNDVSLSAGDSGSLMSSGAGYSYYVLVDMQSGRTNAQIAADIRAKAAPYADGERVVFGVQESTMDLSAMAGNGITITIAGDDIDALQQAAEEIAALCAQVGGAVEIDDGAEELQPKLMVTVDKELASDNSLSVAQVYQYIAQRLYGAVELTDAKLDGREYTLYVSEDRNIDLTIQDVADMEIEVVGTDKTYFVRIGDIAEISEGTTLSSINRTNQRRNVTVSFQLDEGYSANLVSRDLEAVLAQYQPPEGCDFEIGGENETVMGYMEDLIYMLLIAVLFIFLIMVAQFQSFKSPIIVMFTIPLAFTGGLLALIITKMDLSIVSMVGFLVLSGVIVNNGIVFIDSVNQMRIGGMSKREALLETGRIRLRPILMTALTTILGMSTMALATGMGAEMMQPMAVVTIGGLCYGTLMTLFVVPVLYDIFNGEVMKAREIEMIKEAAGLQREGFEEGSAPIPAVAAAAPAVETVPEASAEPAVETMPETSAEPAVEAEPEAGTEPAVEAEPEAGTEPAEDISEASAEPVEAAEAEPAPEANAGPAAPIKPVPTEIKRVTIKLK